MISTLQWDGKLHIPDALQFAHDGVRSELVTATMERALQLVHDGARSELVKATMERGPIAEAAKRVAQLCLPHFEWEERTIFPALGLVADLAQGNLRPEMAKVLPMIAEFSARQDELDNQHRSALLAIEALLRAAHREKNREFAEFAYNLKVHERLEDEVIFPMIILIGKYLRPRLVTQ